MDKNIKDKIKGFLKKEGFYVVLLVTLCILATVAVTSMNKKQDNSKTSPEFSLDTTEANSQKENAERVKENAESEVAQQEQVDNNDESLQTSSNVQIQFVNPVEGRLVREYTYPKPMKVSENTYRNLKGIDIVANVGTPVKVAAQGVVEEIGNQADEGVYVIIDHGNGLKTKYSNLDATLEINKGDNVASETVIGKVGNSAKVLSNKLFGEHLNLQVMDSNGTQVDPTQYFKYELKE